MRRRPCLWTCGPRSAPRCCAEPRAAGSLFCHDHRVRGTARGRIEARLDLNGVGFDLWSEEERAALAASPPPRSAHLVTPEQAQARAEGLRPILLEAIAAGSTSYGQIAAALRARGLVGPRGGAWNATLVQRACQRIRLDPRAGARQDGQERLAA